MTMQNPFALLRRAVLALALLAVGAAPAHAQFRAELAPATDPASLRVRTTMEQSEHMARYAAGLNSWVRLPRPVTIRMLECPASDLRWVPEQRAVEVCYRMAIRVMGIMAGGDSLYALAGAALEFMLFHGVAHAIVDELNLPTPAGEEQAVDELAALLLVHTGARFGTELVRGVTTLQRMDARWAQWDYATAHGLTPERFENVACIAYGANPRVFGAYREQGLVPAARAGRCAAAYQRVAAGLGQRLQRHMH
jgi:hypothetical protein